MPKPKSTIHASPDEAAYGDDVQDASGGVFGNAVWLIVGPEVTVRSTMDSNSFIVGNRKPGPALEQYDWALDHVMYVVLACCCHTRFVRVSVTNPFETRKRDVG